MATVSVSSTQITNRDAVPRVLSNSRITKGTMLCSTGVCAAGAGDSIGSKYKLAQIPSNARVHSVLLACDSVGTVGAADFGIYQTTENGGAVVDADFFKAAQALTSALTATNITYGNTSGLGVEEAEKPLWEALGLTADSKRDYDVVATVTTAIDAAAGGDISLQVAFVI
jgi:hypothetical protein